MDPGQEEELRVRRLGDVLWEIPCRGRMRVPGRIYADESLLALGKEDRSLQQVANVAELPGVVGYSLAMPDIHWGYGFPIGGVAAMTADGGVVSPGGVGYDINCGVRLVTTGLLESDVRPRLAGLMQSLYRWVPCGVGSSGGIAKLGDKELRTLCRKGSRWAVDRGYGTAEDLRNTEDQGCLEQADPDCVSPRAVQRGLDQIGTLGSGNHFLEVGIVEKVFDPAVATAFGLEQGQVTLLIHTGSRGFGYQICDDFLKQMVRALPKMGIEQLAFAPLGSGEAGRYLSAMACAANYAWANRQVIMALASRAFEESLGRSRVGLKIRLVYDVSHNIAKMEKHLVAGRELELCVHRKGATRAYGPGHPGLPEAYRSVGQPVLIPGDMGSASFLCVGTLKAMEETFGSTCHGAGRVLSRTQATRQARGRNIAEELARQGIEVLARERKTLAEEMPEAYKDIDRVVEVMHEAGISRKVARIKPIGVIKG